MWFWRPACPPPSPPARPLTCEVITGLVPTESVVSLPSLTLIVPACWLHSGFLIPLIPRRKASAVCGSDS